MSIKHRGDRDPNKLARRGAFWWVLPIAAALVLTAWGRVDRAVAAYGHLQNTTRLVHEVSERAAPQRCALGAGDMDAIVGRVVNAELGDGGDKAAVGAPEQKQAARARALVQTVAMGLEHRSDPCADPFSKDSKDGFWQALTRPSASDQGSYWHGVALDLMLDAALAMVEIGILLAVVGGLFIGEIFRASREVLLPGAADSFGQRICRERDWRLLQRRSVFFARRLGLFQLVAVGAEYLIAPLGLQASILSNYVRLHPALGALSRPAFADDAGSASPVAVGFFGFLVYMLLTLTERARMNNLDDRIFRPLLIRGITVLILSVVLTGLTDNVGPVSRALVFLAGVFPLTAIDEIAKMAKVSVQKVTDEEGTGFEVLAGINRAKQLMLREVGLTDTSDLACTNLEELMLTVAIEPEILLAAVDEAILFHAIGEDAAKKLQARGIQAATDLIAWARKNAIDKIEDKDLTLLALGAQVDGLEANPNVRYILRARAEGRVADTPGVQGSRTDA
jgi:hypothetical protein